MRVLLRLLGREEGRGCGREELRARSQHGAAAAPRRLHTLFVGFVGQTRTLLFPSLFTSGPKFFTVLTSEKGSLCLRVTLPTLPYKYGTNKTFLRDAASERFTSPVCFQSLHSVSILERSLSGPLPALGWAALQLPGNRFRILMVPRHKPEGTGTMLENAEEGC